ncbi:MAG: GHMP kinase [Planctomycetes bacterium]|nr:GHMP kinase [Planctomycetota bacterium]
MIITKTPFRISLAGGGTDFADFYAREPGCVTSTAIDKYMYITVKKRFDETFRVSYSKTEIVERAADVQHPIVREALLFLGIEEGLEITSISDIPAGTGIGSSSSFTVGLLHALHAFRSEWVSRERLAEEACAIEIERLGEPIGKQDQYIAAFGGLQHIEFRRDGAVSVEPVIATPGTRRALERRLLFFYTGRTRRSGDILSDQRRNADRNHRILARMRDLARDTARVLREGRDLSRLGEILHEGWELKRSLASGISDPEIDALYERSRRAGALGGKILGAGGGGFLLLYAEEGVQDRVRAAAAPVREVPIRLEPEGSRVIYVGGS